MTYGGRNLNLDGRWRIHYHSQRPNKKIFYLGIYELGQLIKTVCHMSSIHLSIHQNNFVNNLNLEYSTWKCSCDL